MTVSNELIDRLLADYKKPEDLIGENGLLKQLTKRLVERALEAEMAEHLGHGKNEPVANPKGHTRNGKSKKRRSRANLANCRSTFPVTGMAVLSRKSCPSIRHGGRGSMTRSSRCTLVA